MCIHVFNYYVKCIIPKTSMYLAEWEIIEIYGKILALMLIIHLKINEVFLEYPLLFLKIPLLVTIMSQIVDQELTSVLDSDL